MASPGRPSATEYAAAHVPPLEGVEPAGIGADPKRALAVLAQGPDVVPEHALGPAPDRERAGGQPQQPVVGARPEAPVAILGKGQDDLLREARFGVESGAPVSADARESFSGPDPEVAVAILVEGAEVPVGDARLRVAREALAGPTREPLVGGDPQLALSVDEELPHAVARQPIARGVGLEGLAVEAADAPRLEGDPQRAVLVLDHVTDVPRADGLRGLDRPDFVTVVAKEPADGPEEHVAGAGLVYGKDRGGEALELAEAAEVAGFVDGEAEPAPDPEAPLPVFPEGGNPAVGKLRRVAGVEDVEAGAVEAGEAGLGPEPEEVVAGLADGVDRVLGKAVVGGPEPGCVLGDRPLGLEGRSRAGDEESHEESGRGSAAHQWGSVVVLGEIGQTIDGVPPPWHHRRRKSESVDQAWNCEFTVQT